MRPTPDETPAGKEEGLSGHLGGLDAARAVAVLGMVMVHFGPAPAPGSAFGSLYGVSHGRASVLFVLLAGVGVALLASGRSGGGRSPKTAVWRARGRLIFRAALLLPLGLWLQGLDHGVLVILEYYAVYFLFAALVLALPDRLLLTLGTFVLLCGPALYFVGAAAEPGWFDRIPATLGDPVPVIARDLLLTGAYPLAVWSAPLLVGIWVGRRNLYSPAVRWWLLGAGLAVALAAPLASDALTDVLRGSGTAGLASDRPHSQMVLWMAGSIGSACAALGGALLAVDRLPRASWPLVATGQLALSVYVGHLTLLAFHGDLLRHEDAPAAAISVGAFMLLAAISCTLWRAVLPRGPLEAALAAPWRTAERAAGLFGVHRTEPERREHPATVVAAQGTGEEKQG